MKWLAFLLVAVILAAGCTQTPGNQDIATNDNQAIGPAQTNQAVDQALENELTQIEDASPDELEQELGT